MSQEKSQELLIEEWGEWLDKPKYTQVKTIDRGPLAQLLENESKYIIEDNNNNVGDMSPFFKVLIPIYRRTYPLISALDLVGVQPMPGPVGLAYALRFRHGGSEADGHTAKSLANQDNTGSNAQFKSQIIMFTGNEVDFNNIGTLAAVQVAGGGDVLAKIIYKEKGGSSTEPNIKILVNLEDGKLLPSAGEQVRVIGIGDVVIMDKFNNEIGYNTVLKNYTGPHTTAQGETIGMPGNEFNTINLSVEKTHIEAKTRKLKTSYTLELLHDLKVVHGLDAEAELLNMAQYEIAAEINQELLQTVYSEATWSTGWSYSTASAPTITADGRFEHEKIRTLLTRIISESNKIATTTRRGAGNVLVASSRVVTALQTLPNFVYSGVFENSDAMTAGLYTVGTLDGRIKVMVDTFAKHDYCLIGYKGNSNSDAGVIYCPYVPLQIMKVDDERTFQKKIGFFTRYAIVSNLYGSSNFYRAFSVDLNGSSIT